MILCASLPSLPPLLCLRNCCLFNPLGPTLPITECLFPTYSWLASAATFTLLAVMGTEPRPSANGATAMRFELVQAISIAANLYTARPSPPPPARPPPPAPSRCTDPFSPVFCRSNGRCFVSALSNAIYVCPCVSPVRALCIPLDGQMDGKLPNAGGPLPPYTPFPRATLSHMHAHLLTP